MKIIFSIISIIVAISLSPIYLCGSVGTEAKAKQTRAQEAQQIAQMQAQKEQQQEILNNQQLQRESDEQADIEKDFNTQLAAEQKPLSYLLALFLLILVLGLGVMGMMLFKNPKPKEEGRL